MLKCPKCGKEFVENSTSTWEKEVEKPINEIIHGGSTVGYKIVYEQYAKCPYCNNIWKYNTRIPKSKIGQVVEQIIHTPPSLWKAAWKKIWNKIFR